MRSYCNGLYTALNSRERKIFAINALIMVIPHEETIRGLMAAISIYSVKPVIDALLLNSRLDAITKRIGYKINPAIIIPNIKP